MSRSCPRSGRWSGSRPPPRRSSLETASFSAEFAGVLRGSLGKSVQMSRDPMRSAAFKVLKQTHAPSVLIELGYMSNTGDAKRLNSPEWQKKVAAAIANAIDAYFSSRTARAK